MYVRFELLRFSPICFSTYKESILCRWSFCILQIFVAVPGPPTSPFLATALQASTYILLLCFGLTAQVALWISLHLLTSWTLNVLSEYRKGSPHEGLQLQLSTEEKRHFSSLLAMANRERSKELRIGFYLCADGLWFKVENFATFLPGFAWSLHTFHFSERKPYEVSVWWQAWTLFFSRAFAYNISTNILHIVKIGKAERPSGKCAKLHSVTASNNRDHSMRSLLSLPFPNTINCSPGSQAL